MSSFARRRLATTRSWISVSMLLMGLGIRTRERQEARRGTIKRSSFLPVDRREQLFQLGLPVGQVLVLQIGDQRFQRRPVRLDPVRPRIAAEIFVNICDVARCSREVT